MNRSADKAASAAADQAADPAAGAAADPAATNQETALEGLVALAVQVIPGCDWAAITEWPVGRGPRTLAASGGTASTADQLQYTLREGPCLTAANYDEALRIDDVADDDRWPAFTQALHRDTPIRAILSVPFTDRPHRTALNMYGARPNAFDTAAVNLGALFAAQAQVMLLHAGATETVESLGRALSASRQIGAAIGILMATHKVREEEAFDLLRESSQHLNRKLRDIATDVTETGELPGQS